MFDKSTCSKQVFQLLLSLIVGANCVGRFTRFDQIIRDFPQIWYLQLIYWKIQFWCCPGVGHLHPIFKPQRGVFVRTPGPIVWHLQLFQNKMTNS